MSRKAGRWLVLLAPLLWSLAAGHGLAQDGDEAGSAGRRLALVIGNADYPDAPLPTVANDAGLVAQSLSQAGYAVVAALDTDNDRLHRVVADFESKLAAAGPQATAFVYLAGYGLQYDGGNYLVPVDARIERASDIPDQAAKLADLLHGILDAPARTHVVVLDLARSSPFAGSGAPLAPGLALVPAPPGATYAFNAAPGRVGEPDLAPYGAYARALSEMIHAPGLPADDLFRRVRLRVAELTNGATVPWDDDGGEAAPPISAAGPTPAAVPVAATDAATAFSAALSRDTLAAYVAYLRAFRTGPLAERIRSQLATRRETLFWSESLRANTPRAFWTYLRRYPRGPHFADVRRRLAALRAPLEPPPRFDIVEFEGLPPPPPDEASLVDEAPDVVDPIPVPSAGLVPPPQAAFYDGLPPPPPEPRGVLPVPMPPIPMPRASATIELAAVSGHGSITAATRRSPDGLASLVLSDAAGSVLTQVTTKAEAGRRVYVQAAADGGVVSRTAIPAAGDTTLSLLTAADGTVLLRTTRQAEPGGDSLRVVANGDKAVLSAVRTRSDGIVTSAQRGPVPPRAQMLVVVSASGAKPAARVATLSALPPADEPSRGKASPRPSRPAPLDARAISDPPRPPDLVLPPLPSPPPPAPAAPSTAGAKPVPPAPGSPAAAMAPTKPAGAAPAGSSASKAGASAGTAAIQPKPKSAIPPAANPTSANFTAASPAAITPAAPKPTAPKPTAARPAAIKPAAPKPTAPKPTAPKPAKAGAAAPASPAPGAAAGRTSAAPTSPPSSAAPAPGTRSPGSDAPGRTAPGTGTSKRGGPERTRAAPTPPSKSPASVQPHVRPGMRAPPRLPPQRPRADRGGVPTARHPHTVHEIKRLK